VSLPWSHPDADPLADIREFMRTAEEAWPPPPFTPLLTPAEEELLARLRRGEPCG
jgi:hypothetical protein